MADGRPKGIRVVVFQHLVVFFHQRRKHRPKIFTYYVKFHNYASETPGDLKLWGHINTPGDLLAARMMRVEPVVRFASIDTVDQKFMNYFSVSPMKDRDRTLSRDVTATQIPSGDKHPLSAGSKVFIHQVLGGSYTVQTDVGLYKLDSGDADAIGEEVVIDPNAD